MRRGEIGIRRQRHDPVRIDRVVAEVIMPNDVIEMHRLGHARHLPQLAQPAPEVRILHDLAAIALEVGVVDLVEPHERGEEPPVRLGQSISH
ncbi:Sulfate transporter [Cereibacter sphaeroides KD131]|nr:Sulfate transporter [Cereibacter sphaeroides KD131]